jgi:hypothetical protein
MSTLLSLGLTQSRFPLPWISNLRGGRLDLRPLGPQSSNLGPNGRLQFRLEHEDGAPADPPTLNTAVPNWSPGDTIPLGRDRALRVVEIRLDPDDESVLVVEHA